MMTYADFIHLRIHSAYSLAEGAIRVKDLVSMAVEGGMPAVAITDTNNIFGSLEFSQIATDRGVQPIIGVQIGLRRPIFEPHKNPVTPPPDQLVLLAQNQTGYMNLMELSSQAFMATDAGEDPQIDWEDIELRNAGLICLTGGLHGPVGRLLHQQQDAAAKDGLARLCGIFGDRLYMEIQRHGLAAEEAIEGKLIDFAYEMDIPLVATNECYYAKAEMYEAHDALICIAAGSYVMETDRRRLTDQHYFKSAAEMRALFADLPEAVDNTLIIAKRCAICAEGTEPLLPKYTKLDGRTSDEALRDLSEAGLTMRLDNEVFSTGQADTEKQELAKLYRERLAFELAMIKQMGFPDYFLIVADFVQWAKDHDIPVGPGRGSGAGSLVAWALTVTDLDPLRYGLLFERFLNPERISMPDFDIDFCQDRREEVIHYVQNEYGRDRVAQIITFGKLQAKAVVRDVGRVLQMPYGQVDRISKLIPANPANPMSLPEALQSEEALRKERERDPAVARLLEIGIQLEGLYRHASTHAAGVVIGDRPLHELVALYRDPRSDMPVTQFNMKYVEQAGLVKFDFLGLKTLTVISKAIKLIEKNPAAGERIDISKISLQDPVTYEMLCRADSTGVFQLESSGMRSVLRDLKPDRLEDLIAAVALYRPGPMENIPTYIERKHGRQAAIYPHPKLEPVLEETFGIPIYQEQVIQMAQILAGYTLGGADLLRLAMGKKIQAEMDMQRQVFVKGAKENSDIEADKADEIFDMMSAFAGYGFNKSHAAAYALVAYQTAWLKANYQVEFLAASMTLDKTNTDKLAIFKTELEAQKIDILPPDVNMSEVDFSVEYDDAGEGSLRYGLSAIKSVGEAAMEAVVAARKANGKFKDIYDFVERVDYKSINKRVMESLAKSGSFDGLLDNRHEVFDNLEILARHGQSVQEEQASDQVSLFTAGVEIAKPKIKPAPEWSITEKLENERMAIGFYLSDHPLNAYKELCAKLGVVQWMDIQTGRIRISKGIRLTGIVGSKRIMTTSKGSKMVFVAVSDASGSYEVTLFQEVLNASRELLDSGAPLLFNVDIKRRGEGEEAELRLTAQAVSSLEDAAANAARGLKILLMDDRPLENLAKIFAQHGKPGRGRVAFHLIYPDGREIEMEDGKTYQIDGKFRQAVKSVRGISDVQDL